MEGSTTRSLKRHVLDLPCRLTRDEQLERGHQLAGTLDEIRTEDSRQEMLKKEMKSATASLEARRDKLAAIVRNGEEYREVPVEDVADYGKGRFMRYRQDTGEIVTERALTDEERQLELKPVGA